MTNPLKYHQWVLTFEDLQKRNTSQTDEEGRIAIDNILRSIAYQLNLDLGDTAGRIQSDKMFLIRNGDVYTYYTFFKIAGEGSQGYCKNMFN